jgi:Na+/H+ antiporter NhaA
VAFLRTEAAGGVVREDLGHWVMVVPAALFVAIAGGGKAGRGWGIPMATDIGFVIGVLASWAPEFPQGSSCSC